MSYCLILYLISIFYDIPTKSLFAGQLSLVFGRYMHPLLFEQIHAKVFVGITLIEDVLPMTAEAYGYRMKVSFLLRLGLTLSDGVLY